MNHERQRRYILAALAMVSLLFVGCAGARSEKRLRHAIERALERATFKDASELRAFYAARGAAPVWVRGDRLASKGRALLQLVCNPADLGLSATKYPLEAIRDQLLAAARRDGTEGRRAERLAALELLLSRLVIVLADDVQYGGFNLPRLQPNWHFKVPSRGGNARQMLDRFARAPDVGKELRRLASAERQSGHMNEALAGYRRLAASGGWKRIANGPMLEVGDVDARVPTIRARLQATGDVSGGDVAGSKRLERTLEEGIRAFQARHGLPVTGIFDPATRAAMNVPVEERITELELNIERERWLPPREEQEYIVINIPDYTLHAYRGGRRVLEMRVVVGTPMKQTPMFADQLSAVVFRPYWSVPQSIAIEEILPALTQDSDYLKEHNFEVVDQEGRVVGGSEDDGTPHRGFFAFLFGGGSVIDERAILEKERRVRQRAGPENALGLIKFVFPNEFDVYLHGTPMDSLFSAAQRAFSHGCIRVQDPVRLAEYVLEINGGWPRSRIEGKMNDPEVVDQAVRLKKTIPLYIVYLTAWVDDEGKVQFRNDPYGLNAELRAAVAAQAGGAGNRALCREIEKLAGAN